MRRLILLIAAAAVAVSSTADVALAHDHAAGSGQRFTFTGKTVQGKDLPITVSASGPIEGAGTVRITEHPSTSAATFRFPRGSIRVLFVHGPTRAHPDPNACRATIEASGSYTIRGGTGRYAAATGKGAYTETRLLLGPRSPSGACLGGPNVVPRSITATATMLGTISLH